MASDGRDLKLEEAFCLFLLGQGSEAEALERLHQLESDKKLVSHNSILRKEGKNAPAADYSLEKWLKDAVLCLFSDTRDCSPSLGSFCSREKKAVSKKQSKGVPHAMQNVNNRMISPAVSSDCMVSNEHLASLVSFQRLGPAAKQLTPTNLQSPLQETKTGGHNDVSMPSPELKRDLAVHHNRTAFTSWMAQGCLLGRIAFVTGLGCIVFATSKMLGRRTGKLHASRLANRDAKWTMCSSYSNHTSNDGTNDIISVGVKQLLSTIKRSEFSVGNQHKSRVAASLSSPAVVFDRVMPVEEAEALVRQWQMIKAEALGPEHQMHLLFDILDGSMLLQWQALAEEATAKSCFWRFVLLQLSILRADILSNSLSQEIAEIDVLLEEAAELVDDSQQKNPNYYSSYRISYTLRRQDDGSWKFCKADINTS